MYRTGDAASYQITPELLLALLLGPMVLSEVLVLTARFEELIVVRLSRTEDDDYLQDQLLRLNKSEARVVLLYATQYDTRDPFLAFSQPASQPASYTYRSPPDAEPNTLRVSESFWYLLPLSARNLSSMDDRGPADRVSN